MRLHGPKTERRKNSDSRSKHILRRVLLTLVTLVLLGLAGMHLLGLITLDNRYNIAEDTVASVLTPLQSGFSSVVESVVNYLYKLKLRANLEIAYNNLKQENEQLVYQAMNPSRMSPAIGWRNWLELEGSRYRFRKPPHRFLPLLCPVCKASATIPEP